LISLPTASDLAAILDGLRRCRYSLYRRRQISQEDPKLLRQIDQIHRDLRSYPLNTLKLLVKMKFPLPRRLGEWLPHYFHLAAFCEHHGHCKLPRTYTPCPTLPEWIRKHRYARAQLEDFRRELLDRLGPTWRERTDDTVNLLGWTRKYQKLKAFKKRYGNCRVPNRWPQDQSLASWVGRQRFSANKPDYPADRRRLLQALGFDWDPHQNNWFKHYGELVEFWKKHGHCQVPRARSGGSSLQHWVHYVRSRHKLLSKEKIRLLDEMGFDWSPLKTQKEMRWKKRFEALEAFVKAHGHARIPTEYKMNPSLGQWVLYMRMRHIQRRLSPEEVQRLNALGFVWSPHQEWWEKRLSELKDFKRKYGDFRAPSQSQTSLGQFCMRMRRLIRGGTLPKEKLEQLRGLGFV